MQSAVLFSNIQPCWCDVPFLLPHCRSLAGLRYQPHQAWLQLYWSVSGRMLRRMQPCQLLQCLAAMAAIKAMPPKRWLREAEQVRILNDVIGVAWEGTGA